jgi:hypothetical protein
MWFFHGFSMFFPRTLASLEDLEALRHGQQRLMDPAFRAQLLGEQTRPKEAEAEASEAKADIPNCKN